MHFTVYSWCELFLTLWTFWTTGLRIFLQVCPGLQPIKISEQTWQIFCSELQRVWKWNSNESVCPVTAFPAKQQTGHALVKDCRPWGDTNMACTHFLINHTCWKSLFFLFLGSYELLQSEGLHYRAVHQYGISWNIFKEIWCKCIYWHKVFNLPVNEILPNPENNPHKEKKKPQTIKSLWGV